MSLVVAACVVPSRVAIIIFFIKLRSIFRTSWEIYERIYSVEDFNINLLFVFLFLQFKLKAFNFLSIQDSFGFTEQRKLEKSFDIILIKRNFSGHTVSV